MQKSMTGNTRRSKNIFYLVTLGIIVLGIFGYITIPQIGKSSNKPSTVSLSVAHISENTSISTIQGEYPQFNGLAEFNAAVKQSIDDRIAEFKKNTEENNTIRQKLAKEDGTLPEFSAPAYGFTLTWSPQQTNKNYISFVMRISAFEGGANERQDIITFNYDVKNKRPISLESLFPDNPSYLEHISTFTKGDLIGQFRKSELGVGDIPLDFVEEGTKPIPDNFSRFTFDDSVVVFYFPKYQVAPGAFGEQTVIMPREK